MDDLPSDENFSQTNSLDSENPEAAVQVQAVVKF
jgi:hypothetical protein